MQSELGAAAHCALCSEVGVHRTVPANRQTEAEPPQCVRSTVGN
jgi:hypothetical protein